MDFLASYILAEWQLLPYTQTSIKHHPTMLHAHAKWSVTALTHSKKNITLRPIRICSRVETGNFNTFEEHELKHLDKLLVEINKQLPDLAVLILRCMKTDWRPEDMAFLRILNRICSLCPIDTVYEKCYWADKPLLPCVSTVSHKWHCSIKSWVP